jgi:Mg-chelatase subunit ChlD
MPLNSDFFCYSSLKGLPSRPRQGLWVFSGFFLLFFAVLLWSLALLPLSYSKEGSYSSEVVSLSVKSAPTQLVLVDTSGSMQKIASVSQKVETRFQVMQEFLRSYIDHNTQDLIGIIAFARRSTIKAPPTFDREFLKTVIDHLQPVSLASDDGTSIGYAVLQGVFLLKNMKESGSFAVKPTLIVMTDGVPTTHPDDEEHPLRSISLMNAAKIAKDESVRLYIVNIGSDIEMSQYSSERRQMVRASELTGGRYFEGKDIDSLNSIGDQLAYFREDKAPVEGLKKISLRPVFLQWGLIFFVMSLFMFRVKAPVYP